MTSYFITKETVFLKIKCEVDCVYVYLHVCVYVAVSVCLFEIVRDYVCLSSLAHRFATFICSPDINLVGQLTICV